MSLNDIRVKLGLPEGVESNGEYTISLANSDDYARMYTKLDKNEDLFLDDENVGVISEHSSILNFVGNEGYSVSLEANFDSDTYKVVIRG